MIYSNTSMDNKMFLVFDDGGLSYANPDNTGFPLSFDNYERILLLAKTNEICIPIACIALFFDLDNIYDNSYVNPDAEKILMLIDKNSDYLILWNHGLTHMCGNSYTEFYNYFTGSVDYKIQEQHLKISQQIFQRIGFETDTFVPPGHAWEQDITDEIAGRYGIRNIAAREFEKTALKVWLKKPNQPYKKRWKESAYLKTFFRLGLGISYRQTQFSRKDLYKTWCYIHNFVINSIFTNRTRELRYPVHHFFAHVQNLKNPNSIQYFNKVIRWIKNR